MAADTTALTAADAHASATTAHDSGGIGNPVLGMLLFIVSEVMFFAGLFAAYFSLRRASSMSTASSAGPRSPSSRSSARSTCGPRRGR